VDSNGFYYALAYADASDGVTASTINTDYVELSITLKTSAVSAFDSTTEASGFTTLQPTNPFPVLSENLLTQNQAFPVDLGSASDFNIAGGTPSIYSNGVVKVTGASSNSTYFSCVVPIVTGTTYAGSADVINPNGSAISVTINIAGGNPVTTSIPANSTVRVKTAWTATTTSSSSSLRFYEATGSEFRLRNIKYQIASTATEWTPGRKKKVTLNYLGKVAGSTVENPHRSLYADASTFGAPSTFTLQATQTEYDNASKQDGVLTTLTSTTNSNYAQRLYEFDLSHLGMTTAQLKAAIRSLAVTVVAYGSGDNGGVLTNGATLKAWKGSWSTSGDTLYGTNTASSPATISQTTTSNTYIDNNQKVYVLVHSTYPAGTNPSNIFTDYVKLDVTLSEAVDYVKSNIVKVNPSTRTIKFFFPAKSQKYLGNGGDVDQVALWYRYIPKQNDTTVGTPDKDLTKPSTFYATTLGTGGLTTENNYLLYQILSSTSDYAGQSLNSFITNGTKMYQFETYDLKATKPSIVFPYVVYAYKLVVKNGQLYLRIMYKESKNLGSYVDLTQTIDFPISGRPLIKV
jgi:hypothetical protein